MTTKSTRLLLFTILCAAGSAQAVDGKPNILHIHADDHRADGLHALGNPVLQTPNLDTLVERGMTFTHCYTMGSMIGAVCTPSRTMMLTGRSWLRIPKAPGALPGGTGCNAPEASRIWRDRDFEAVRRRYPFRSSALRWSNTLRGTKPKCAPISRTVGG